MRDIIADCFDALTYTAHFADTLGIDKDRIAVSGHSAGAHLALMLAYAPRSEFDDGYVFDDTYTVKAAAPMSAPTILYEDKMHNLKSNLASAFSGCDTYEERVRTSPITYDIARKTDTFKWLEKFKAKWRLKNKESELCEIEKLFLGMEEISNKQKKPEYESS